MSWWHLITAEDLSRVFPEVWCIQSWTAITETWKLSYVCLARARPPNAEPVSVAPLLLGFVSLACTLSQSWKGWDGRGRRVMVVVVEGGGVNLSTSKGLWRYSGAHHSASSFLPLLHSLPKPFPAYQHFSAQRERGRRGNRERVSQAEAQPVSETELRQFKAL